MKSFFLLVFGLVLPLGLSAVNISSVYFSSCNRENGVIIHVDENRVQMLGLDGAILDIPRYEIIYMSYYPLGEALKVPEMKEPTESKLYTIKTLHNGEVVDLVSGWLIDHSDDRFSFLSLTGVEQVVDAEDIWDLEEGHPCRGECPAQENKPAELEASHLQLSRNQYDLRAKQLHHSSTDKMQRFPMLAKPFSTFIHVRIQHRNRFPESGTVVRLLQMRHLVSNHVVKNESRCKDQTPAVTEVAV